MAEAPGTQSAEPVARALVVAQDGDDLARATVTLAVAVKGLAVTGVAGAEDLHTALDAGGFTLVVFTPGLRWLSPAGLARAVGAKSPGVPVLALAPAGGAAGTAAVRRARRRGPALPGPSEIVLQVEMQQSRSLRSRVEHSRRRVANLVRTLRRQRDVLDAIMANTRTQLAYLDRDFNFVRVNEAYAKGCGRSREEILGRNHFDLFPDPGNEAVFRRVRDTGNAAEFRARPFTYADDPGRGTTYWDWTLAPVFDGRNQVQGLVFSLVEVTGEVLAARERERLLAANREQREFLEQLLATAPVGIAVVRGPEHRYEFVNRAYRSMPGMPDTPFAGRTVAEVLPERDAKPAAERLDAVYRSGAAVSTRELPLGSGGAAGGTYWNIDAVPLRGPAGEVNGILILANEVTANVLARVRAGELAARNRAILEHMREGLIIFDLDGNVITMNDKALALHGFADPGEPRRPVADYQARFDVTYPDGRPMPLQEWPLRRVLRGETVDALEARVRHLDTGRTWIGSYSGTLIRDPSSGAAQFGLLTLRDVTAEKEGTQRLSRMTMALEQARNELEERVELRTAELARANEVLRYQADLLAHVQDAVIATDTDFRITAWNPAAEAVYGWARSQALGRRIAELFEPAQSRSVLASLTAGGQFSGEYTHTRPDGRRIVVDLVVISLLDDASRAKGWVSVGRDVTRRVEAEQAVRRRAEEQSMLREIGQALASSLDPDRVLSTLLEQVCLLCEAETGLVALRDPVDGSLTIRRVAGWIPDTLVGHRFGPGSGVAGWVSRERRSEVVPAIREDPRFAPDVAHVLGGRAVDMICAPLLAHDEVIGVLELFNRRVQTFGDADRALLEAVAFPAAVALDNARLFEALRLSRERLQTLSRRLVEAQETERRYVARELHDDAGQALAALAVKLQLLEREAGEGKALAARIAEVQALASGVQENLHRLATGLRPATLDHLGLVAACRHTVSTMQHQRGPLVQFEALGFGRERLPAEVETALFRVVQEALTNAIRHAQASHIDVVLERHDDRVIALVEDDGVGFDPDASQPGEHMGLVGMRERVDTLGGVLLVDSRPSSGTTIVAEVPLEHPSADR